MTRIGGYICPFYHNSGEICGKSCMKPEGCHIHWKAKKRVPCSDCNKPTGSTSGRCPLHIRGYYVTQYYNRLRSNIRERTYEEIMDVYRLRSNMRERTYEEIMLAHRDVLTNLNITLCKECFHPIKLEEGEYCDSCQPE